MQKTTRQEKELVRTWVDRYQRGPGASMTVQQYKRLVSWLSGQTFAEIAEEEGVRPQTVAYSVKREVKSILKFAEEQNGGQ